MISIFKGDYKEERGRGWAWLIARHSKYGTKALYSGRRGSKIYHKHVY
jgi:hypothetical protein